MLTANSNPKYEGMAYGANINDNNNGNNNDNYKIPSKSRKKYINTFLQLKKYQENIQ